MIEKFDNIIISKNSVPVTNNPHILQYMCDKSVFSHRNNEKNLTQNNIEEMTELFGKQNKSLRLEFFTKLWILKYNDLLFNVYSAKGKGMSIEICSYSYEDIRTGVKEKEILEFLEELYNLINKK